MQEENVVIIGGACAGLTAALYTARANLHPLLIEGYQAGGQLMLTSEVENYPGFPKGILGPELMSIFRQQAERFDTRFITKDVTAVDFSKQPYVIKIEEESIHTKSVIIATGASSNLLGLPNEKRLLGKGVSTCATCDGAFFKESIVAVAGGGDSAVEEATFLTKHATQVILIHRRDTLRASKIMQERAFKNKKISFRWNTEVTDVLGKDAVTGLRLQDTKTKTTSELTCDGFFVAIGHTPNTSLFEKYLTLRKNKYLDLVPGTTQTNLPGIFAAGDVQDFVYRQAITAAGSGCMAALECERYLESVGH